MRAPFARLVLAAALACGGALALGGCDAAEPLVRQAQQALAQAAEEAAPESPPADRAQAPAADEAAAPPGRRDLPEPSASGKRVYYQYVDASGAVRFVERLEDVPADKRADAGRVEMDPIARAGSAEPRAAARPTAPQVVVYTTSWCGWCRKTLAWLDDRGVDYVNKDIEANPHHRDELIEKTGRTSIPVVEIEGSLIRGYDPDRMASLL